MSGQKYLEDLQQKHLASDASSHQLEKLLPVLQEVTEKRQYRALQHALYDQTPWLSLTSTMQWK